MPPKPSKRVLDGLKALREEDAEVMAMVKEHEGAAPGPFPIEALPRLRTPVTGAPVFTSIPPAEQPTLASPGVSPLYAEGQNVVVWGSQHGTILVVPTEDGGPYRVRLEGGVDVMVPGESLA